MPLLPIEPAIAEIAATYIQQRVMPADPTGDALHLAIASYHKCDFLVTWNCRHIANANKFGQIRRINTLLGLFVPALVTPLELLGVDHDSTVPPDPAINEIRQYQEQFRDRLLYDPSEKSAAQPVVQPDPDKAAGRSLSTPIVKF